MNVRTSWSSKGYMIFVCRREGEKGELSGFSVGCPHIWTVAFHTVFTVVPIGLQWEEVGVLL